MPEVRALPSAGITRPQRYYGPVRRPPVPSPNATLKPQPPNGWASPDYPRYLSDVPCPLPRWTETGARVDCFPVRAAFPVTQAGRRPYLHFRGLLGLHSRYGPPDRSTAQGGRCHEASARPVAQPDRSSATRPVDNSLGGTFLHWQHAPSGRTEKSGLAPEIVGANIGIILLSIHFYKCFQTVTLVF